MRHDPAAFAVDGADHAIDADGVGKSLRARDVGDAVLEQRRSDDDLSRADRAELDRALGRAHAAADLAGQPRADLANEMIVRARAHGRVEVDDVDAPKPGEPLDPVVEIGRLDGELLALNQLDDLAALEIDGGNQHVYSRTGMPRSCSMRLRSRTACSEK